MDFEFLAKIFPLLLQGAKMTVLLTVLAIFFGTILGLISALMRLSRFKVLNGISWFYTWSIRRIPLIVQLFIWYFGFPSIGIQLSAFTAGVCALSVCEGAYISEIIRGGITSINKGQNEAALSIGMTNWQSMRRIVLPQAIKVIVLPFGNECITSMKDTALVSVISLVELMRKATILDATYVRSMEIYMSAAIVYLIMTSTIMVIIYFLSKKFNLRGEYSR